MTGASFDDTRISFSGPDSWRIGQIIWERWGHRFEPTRREDVAYSSARWRKVPANWRDLLPWRKEEFAVYSGQSSERHMFMVDHETVFIRVPQSTLPLADADALLTFFDGLPFTIASINTVHDIWFRSAFEQEYPRISVGFGQGHVELGFGAAFKGDGHLQVTSRRNLDYGPWRTLRDEANDTTLIQFHDHRVDAVTAYTQARSSATFLGYGRLPIGCFFHDKHPFNTEPQGRYNHETKRIRVLLTDGRDEFSPERILDLKALCWFEARNKGLEIHGIDVVVFDEDDALNMRTLCWLNELGLLWWKEQDETIDMMAGFAPDKTFQPDWVRELDGPRVPPTEWVSPVGPRRYLPRVDAEDDGEGEGARRSRVRRRPKGG